MGTSVFKQRIDEKIRGKNSLILPSSSVRRQGSVLPGWLVIAFFLVVAVGLKQLFINLRNGFPSSLPFPQFVGYAFVTSVGAILFGFYLLAFERSLILVRRRLLGAGILFSIFLVIGEFMSSLNLEMLPYFIPVSVMAILANIFFGQRFAFMFVLCGCVLLSFFREFPVRLVPFDWVLFGSLSAGGIASVFAARRLDTRTKFVKIALYAATAHFLAIFGLNLIDMRSGASFRVVASDASRYGLFGLLNGVACGFFLSGFLPFFERVFKLSTDIRLKELSDLNQPVLRRFLLEAPGTYHHSLLVGTLAESAAQQIGANPLLARVGAYFHDIGKITKPDYFTENEQIKGTKHASLSPHLSTLVIVSHVKDGVEIAEEINLPADVIRIIREHHGTSVVEYFYREAIGGAKGKDEKIPAELFRYPGPKPSSREAAVVMLADSIEAASRALEGRSPGKIEGIVHDIVMRRLLDGQLDESGLTLTDIKHIEEAFVKVILGIFHTRVAYDREEKSPRKGENERKEVSVIGESEKDAPVGEEKHKSE